MNTTNIMQLIMIFVILLCGYMYLFQVVQKKNLNRSAMPLIAVVLFVLYVLIMGSVVFMLTRMGSMEMTLMALMILFSMLIVISLIYNLFRYFHDLNKGVLSIFAVYTLMVAYITLFSRDVRKSTDIVLQFSSIQESMRTGSTQPLQHFLLNTAMFVPFGFLFPLIFPEKLDRWLYVTGLGLMLTTLIEATQMYFKLGQTDVGDMVSNTLGILAGFILYKLFARVRGHLHLDDDDVEDEYDDEEEE